MIERLRKLWLCIGISAIGLGSLAWWHYQSLQISYTKLEQLLAARQWMKADLETSILMNKLLLTTIDQQTFFGYSRLNFPDGRKFRLAHGGDGGFPCADLEILDKLWSSHSKGNFGFNTQLKIAKNIADYPESNTPDKIRWL
jgi:hypothetical protein